mmetsp:Transcript_85273/g.275207  ORF Transcript_85273/g.275207 Transcript_85273/m.275207 type:complete len:180 (+) Transcript_85273:97-636(+)
MAATDESPTVPAVPATDASGAADAASHCWELCSNASALSMPPPSEATVAASVGSCSSWVDVGKDPTGKQFTLAERLRQSNLGSAGVRPPGSGMANMPPLVARASLRRIDENTGGSACMGEPDNDDDFDLGRDSRLRGWSKSSKASWSVKSKNKVAQQTINRAAQSVVASRSSNGSVACG